jgi:hypothetical protein
VSFQKNNFGDSSAFGAGITKIVFIMRIADKGRHEAPTFILFGFHRRAIA